MNRWICFSSVIALAACADTTPPAGCATDPKVCAAGQTCDTAKNICVSANMNADLSMSSVDMRSGAADLAMPGRPPCTATSPNWCLVNPLPAADDLYSVWGSGLQNVWLVGSNGRLMHYDNIN